MSNLLCLLEMRPNERSAKQLQDLRAATAHIKFFQSLSADLHTACCKVMHLAEYQAGEVVFSKGDPGDSFCIIISGSVNALIPPNSTTPLTSLRPVCILSIGQAFGELALLHNKDRAATIQTRSPTSLAVLNKADFTRILHRFEEKRLHSKVQFFRSLPAFAEWSEARMERLVYFFQETACVKGQVVYRQRDLPDHVYVTIAGEFQFRQDLAGTKSANSLRKNEAVLKVIGAKELFGEREVISGESRQSSCVCCSQSGSLYFIPKEDFLKFYTKKSTQSCLQRVNDEKERWLHQRQSQILKAEEVISAVNLQGSPEARAAFRHSSSSLCLKRDLQKFSNLSLLAAERSKKVNVSVGEKSAFPAVSKKNKLILVSTRMPKSRKSVSYPALPLFRRFSAILS